MREDKPLRQIYYRIAQGYSGMRDKPTIELAE